MAGSSRPVLGCGGLGKSFPSESCANSLALLFVRLQPLNWVFNPPQVPAMVLPRLSLYP